MKGPVVLLGPPGAGKSTAGARAAARLGMRFVDLDLALGDAAALFRHEGEASFRVRELRLLDDVLDGSDVLVAAGSGVVDTAPARAILDERALCVVLDASLDVAVARLQASAGAGGAGGARPWLPLDAAGARAAWLERVRRRHDAWSMLATARVDGDGPLESVVGSLADTVDALRPIVPRASDVHVVDDVPAALAAACAHGPVHVVVDDAVADRVAAAVRVDVLIPGGERAKTLQQLEALAQRLVALGVRRDGTIVAVGGGAVLDAVGLCAALLFRGVPWVAVPTTLLAQADAGLGGKTAVDLAGQKNLLGAFHAPRRTVICSAFLSTLGAPALQAGRVEMLKHEMLAADAPLDGSARGHDGGVERSLAVKWAVVRRDPRERGGRAALNLGHTLGHALEAAFGLAHGQAVQHGLRAMLRLSVAHARLAPAVAATLDARVLAAGPLAPLPHLRAREDEVLALLGVDKKADRSGPRWVLLRAPGLPVLARVPELSVREAIRGLGDGGVAS